MGAASRILLCFRLLMNEMTSSRPYLLRAIYEWIVDNGMTPYLLVDATLEGVQVPAQYVQDGKIILNVAPRAVVGLDLGNDSIQFHARFSGVDMALFVPIKAALAIYAQENGQGMAFGEEGGDNPPPEPSPDKPRRPSLKVVK
jgi:stringent starvation protein B